MFLALVISLFFLFITQSYLVLYWAPLEITQGIIQKIFYYHVPTAWSSFIAFTSVFIYSILFLKKRDIKYHYKGVSHTIVGWTLTSGVLITGPLWAKPVWGSFWNWSDERLVTFFILWLSYTSYLLLNASISSLQKKAQLSSILGILSFVNIPIVYMSIRIWKTPSHPGAMVGGEQGNLLTTEMHFLIWLSVCLFLGIYFLTSHVCYKLFEQQHQLKILENQTV